MRLCKFQSRWARTAVDGFLVVLAILCLMAKIHRPAPVWIFGFLTEALMVGSCFSLLLIGIRGASEWVSRTSPGRILSFLGIISYSLYLIHQFNLNFASTVITHILPAWVPRLLVEAGIVGFHITLATVFWFFCERPFVNEKTSLTNLFTFTRKKQAA